MHSTTKYGPALVGILLVLAATANSHSFLISPQADWTNQRQPECRIGKPDGPQYAYFDAMNCPGPCGETGKIRYNSEFFSESQGHTTLSRGQKLYMKWTKNNHQSGFVRFTLVPKSQRMNKDVHEKFAFHYACWEAGEIGCDPGDQCGTDENRRRYQTEVEIPRIFPDGEYILGWAWYGGSMYRDGSDKAEFGDYWSCANVAIRGSIGPDGVWYDDPSLSAEYTPVFIPGMNDKSQTQCRSAVNRLGICATEPCYGRYEVSLQVPAGFENGASPAPVRAADVVAAAGAGQAARPPTNMFRSGGDGSSNNYSNGMNSNGGGAALTIERLELVNTWDESVVTSDFSRPIDASALAGHMTVRAVVSPTGAAAAVEFSADGVWRREVLAPYHIAGNGGGRAAPWAAPMDRDLTLTVRATGRGGEVAEVVAYPHFRS
jgi:hypothetical protein